MSAERAKPAIYLQSYLSTLQDKDKDKFLKFADCDVCFYRSSSGVDAVDNQESSSGDNGAAADAGRPSKRAKHDHHAWLTERIPSHKLVLAAFSARLEAHLVNPGWHVTCQDEPGNRNSQQISTTDGAAALETENRGSCYEPQQRPLLAVPLEGEHEVDGALEVLRFMYSVQLSPRLSPLQLLMVRKVAQYLLCSPCTEACTEALAKLQDIAPADAKTVCSSPHVATMLCEPELAGFMAVCAAALAHDLNTALSQPAVSMETGSSQAPGVLGISAALAACLSNTARLMRSERLAAAFFSLSLATLQHLLQPAPTSGGAAASPNSTLLPVDCEETLVLLLHRWVQHTNPTAEGKQQLRKLLRPQQLGAMYAQYMLPTFPWLGLSSSDIEELQFAMHAARTTTGAPKPFMGNLALFKAEPQWLQSRTYTPPAPEDATITATWSRQQLQLCLEEARPKAGSAKSETVLGSLHGLKVYWAGMEMSLRLDVTEVATAGTGTGDNASPAVKGSLYLCATNPSVNGITLGPKCSVVLPPFKLSAQRDGADCKKEVVMNSTTWLVTGLPANAGWGWRHFFMSEGALDMASWEPFLVQGCVRATGTLSMER